MTTAKGSVNFTDGELAMTVHGYGPSGKGMVSMEVREIGDMEYSFVPFAPLDAAGWVARRVPRTLDELQFPLYALSARDKVSVEGHAKLQGVATTTYVIHMPGGTSDGVHVAPYPLLVYLDAKGRIRQAGQVASETGIKGHSGPLNFYSSVEFTDFGAPVHVQVPKVKGTTQPNSYERSRQRFWLLPALRLGLPTSARFHAWARALCTRRDEPEGLGVATQNIPYGAVPFGSRRAARLARNDGYGSIRQAVSAQSKWRIGRIWAVATGLRVDPAGATVPVMVVVSIVSFALPGTFKSSS